ncbi:MAG: hypothetical protein PHF18_06385 [Methanosarcina sp.]|uniref:hypothetical protein n=1 Tax=Methanosarcina sp. TaxID=2213 RepID=UPI00262C04EA|nr:hypothetical protein [Methanosarcina sp.]MDD3246466.1 hypothetical protein [Methanosarcina sp.]
MAPQENLIHIGDVNVTTSVKGNSGKVKGVAVVTILDNNNNPVEDAKVSGYWSGEASDTFSNQKTENAGTVMVYSNEVKYTGTALTFTFYVNDVTHDSYTWDGNTVPWMVAYP